MAELGTNGTTAGNTNSAVATKERKTRNFLLTINNPTISSEELAQILDSLSCKYVFQLEQGASGTKHFQTLICYDNAVSFNSVKKLFPTAHIEKAKGIKNCVKYCSKRDTRIGETFSKGFHIPSEPKIISELRPWQNQIKEILLSDKSDRTIHWVYDPDGNIGKTAFCRYFCVQFSALYLTGKSADLKYAITECLEHQQIQYCLFDYTRSQEEFISYQGIEEIKNGIFFNTKYESKMTIFNSPVICCFANFLPDFDKLSRDRWECYRVVDNNLISYSRYNE